MLQRCRVLVVVVVLNAALAGAANGQGSGSLERLIVGLPTGCTTREESTKPGSGGTFSFSYTCFEKHDVTFTVSLPSSVQISGSSGGWYELASPASATASVSWKWTTPATTFGNIFTSAGLRLFLSAQRAGSATCAAPETLRFFLQPGVHTLASTLPCSVTRMESWSSGEPGDTTQWARFWASTYFGAHDGQARQLFPVEQFAQVTGIYRMSTGPSADLAVTIDSLREVTDRDAPFTVTVRNLGPQAAADVVLTLRSDEDNVRIFTSTSACSPFVDKSWQTSVCNIPSLEAGATASVSLEIGPENDRDSEYTRLSATVSSATPDPSPANNQAKAGTRYTHCGDTLQECAFNVFFRGDCVPSLPAQTSVRTNPLERALSGARKSLSTLAAAAVDLYSLYRLRDEVFTKTAAGRRYTELYYAHTAEVAGLIATNPGFSSRFGDTYALWKDNISKLVAGQGASAPISQAQIDSLTGFIDQLETLAGPELRAVLTREQAALNLPSLAGKSMDQALAQQQSTAPATVTIPAAASIHGLGTSFFHSDLRVLNPSTTSSVTVTARYRCFTGPCPSSLEKTFTVAPRELKVYDDVVGTLFAAPETAGAIELAGAVLAESRVYTPSKPAPTTGSDVPGLSADEAYAESVLTSLSRSGFRTNVGIYNPGGDTLSVSIDVYRPDGVKLGTATRTVGARTAVQVNDVFSAAGIADEPADAYAIVRADGIHELFAYATVIDNQSQDSVFVKGRNARGAEPFLTTIPAAASIHGVPPAFFHSDVRLFNPAGAAPRNVIAVYRCITGSCPPLSPKTLIVQPGEMSVLDDIVANLFQAPETAGAIDISGSVLVDSRVYTPTRPAPTTGTGIPGQPEATAAVEAALLSLSHSADAAKGFRTNAGVFNPNPTDLSVTISLRRPDGTELAKLTRTVPSLSAVQVNNVFVTAGVTSDVPSSYALVTGDGLRGFFAYATVIDNQSQDSVYVKGRPLRAP